MRRTAITVNYLQVLCLLVVLFFFLRRVALVVGVLLFFEEFTLLAGVLACLLSSKNCSACCVICFDFFEGLLYLWGHLACGVVWLVERWSFVSCFFSFYK